MSQENVEIVQAGFAAWNAGDMDAVEELFAPDIVLRLPEGWPEPGPYVGREAAIRQYEQNREVFDSDRLEPISDFIGVGDRVLVRLLWRGMGYGPEAAQEWTILCTVRRAGITSIEYFWDHGEALEAAGLSEQPMSQENVEIVRSIYAAWERGDFTSAEWAHPDIELVVADSFDAGTVTGLAGMAEAWHDWLSAWEDYRVEVDEYRKLDDERILVLMLHCGRGKTSGLDVGQTGTKRAGANLLHVRDGCVTRLVLYWDRERALADLGLKE